MSGLAFGLGILGSLLQLIGSVMTLWSLVSATETWRRRVGVLVGALWRSERSEIAAELSELNKESRIRILQGVALLVVGYLLALVSQVWEVLMNSGS